MQNYQDLVKDVLENGVDRPDRTGVGSRAVFGRTLRFDLSKGFPALTTRRVPFRIAFEETMFFLRGETDTKKLEEKKINIWKGNTSREFLDSRGLTHLPEGDMGKGYGYQWCKWEKHTPDGAVQHINQVKNLIEGIQKNPNDRRAIVLAWNPGQLDEMALPPCHLYHQYTVLDGKLHSSFVMRSNDVIYGLPFNIMGYAFINAAIAKICNLEQGELVYFGNDVHIYHNQLEIAAEQLTREPKQLPRLVIKKDIKSYEDLCELEYSDVELVGYDPHPDFKNKPPMAV